MKENAEGFVKRQSKLWQKNDDNSVNQNPRTAILESSPATSIEEVGLFFLFFLIVLVTLLHLLSYTRKKTDVERQKTYDYDAEPTHEARAEHKLV